MAKQDFGTPAIATNGTTPPATATITGVAGSTFYVTDISGSSDLSTSTIQVKDGSTVIWQSLVGNTVPYYFSFKTALGCTIGNTVTVVVTGTSSATANVSGYFLTP